MKIHKKSNDYTLLLKKYIYKNAAYAFTRFPTFQAKKKNSLFFGFPATVCLAHAILRAVDASLR